MASDAQNASSLIGKTIGGRYTIKATIGSGGMGHVYRATQAPINREVAIKVLRVDLAHQEGVADRFKREARAASMIQHPNAITIFDFDQDGDILYLAMEFLSGETLRQRLRREPVLELNEALDLFESMAGALGAAHKVGVVHRDLKPDNIFLAKFDAVGQVVKVLDFGLAKLLDRAADNDGLVTEANLRLGTPRYMAPEQALGIQPIDSRCDVYALGLLLFEMLAQRAPFVGEDGMEVLAQRLRREAPRLSSVAPAKRFGEEMDELLATMLKRDREHRPQDANVVLARVRDIRKNNLVTKASESQEAAPPAEVGRSGTYPRSVPPNAAYGAPPAAPPRGRPPTQNAIAAQPRGAAEAMVRLDQDDFPEKPTVVVDPGTLEGPTMSPAAMQAQMRASNPGQPLAPPMIEPQMQMQMQMQQGYTPNSMPPQSMPSMMGGMSGPYGPNMGGSASVPPVPQKKKRTLLLVALVVVIAVSAPLIAWLVRYLKNDERVDPPPPTDVVTTTKKPAPAPPPPKDSPEVKAKDEPKDEPTTPDKPTKKGPGGKKKNPPAKKPEPKADPKAKKAIF